MAGLIDSPSTGEIWHLTIDDLLAPLPETSRLGGRGPFVINLSASSAPIAVPAKGIAGYQDAYLYQVQRTEDGRVRYRLRLGPFSNEDDADAALKKVRDDYPSALPATADADDLRAIATLQAKSPAPSKPLAAKAPGSPAPTAIVPPTDRISAAVPTLSQPVPTRPNKRVLPTTLAPSAPTSERKIPVRTPASAPAPPTPVAAKPVDAVTPTVASAMPVPTPEQRVPARAAAAVPAAAPAAAPVPTPPAVRAPAPSAIAASTHSVVRATAPAVATALAPSALPAPSASTPRLAGQFGKRVPDLETTQTIRALTQLELENDQASRWFAIQLSLSEEAFDPETVPNLDIFSVYRLYCVAGIDQGRIVHALRVGFFSEQSAAAAVASYLTAFYEKPSIKRVSSAERDRFTDHPLEPRKDVGATGKQAVIEITDERYIREKRIGQTAAK